MARSGRFGVVTNYRDLQAPVEGAPSRGQLVPRFLTARPRRRNFSTTCAVAAPRYSGFNLLVGGARALYYFSNRGPNAPAALAPGVYGLSNHLLDTPWPKLARTRQRFEELPPAQSRARRAVRDARRPRAGPDDHLPSTGLPPDWERVVSAPFIVNERYGTRCSSVLLVERNGRTVLQERRFDAAGVQSGTSRFEFRSVEVPEVWFEAERSRRNGRDRSFVRFIAGIARGRQGRSPCPEAPPCCCCAAAAGGAGEDRDRHPRGDRAGRQQRTRLPQPDALRRARRRHA